MTEAAPEEWSEASWPARVIALSENKRTGEAMIGLEAGPTEIVLALPKDHTPPVLGEELLVTLRRAGAQP